MMSPDTFAELVEQQRLEALARIGSVRISALLWGPDPKSGTSVSDTRVLLRETLEGDGHLVHYSEDLYDAASPFSLLAQQVAHVEAHDITFALPDSPGSIAEIHDFARIPTVSNRIVTFVDEAHNAGYSNTTLVQLESTVTCKIQVYTADQLPHGIVERARSLVRRLQEFYYCIGRRY